MSSVTKELKEEWDFLVVDIAMVGRDEDDAIASVNISIAPGVTSTGAA